jgi:hypothetical protein
MCGGNVLLQKASYKWVLIILFISFSALTKSTGLRTEGKIDERSFWINYVTSLSAPLAIPLVYPRMVAIHDLDSKVYINQSTLKDMYNYE